MRFYVEFFKNININPTIMSEKILHSRWNVIYASTDVMCNTTITT